MKREKKKKYILNEKLIWYSAKVELRTRHTESNGIQIGEGARERKSRRGVTECKASRFCFIGNRHTEYWMCICFAETQPHTLADRRKTWTGVLAVHFYVKLYRARVLVISSHELPLTQKKKNNNNVESSDRLCVFASDSETSRGPGLQIYLSMTLKCVCREFQSRVHVHSLLTDCCTSKQNS